jgi:hypothetical protein
MPSSYPIQTTAKRNFQTSAFDCASHRPQGHGIEPQEAVGTNCHFRHLPARSWHAFKHDLTVCQPALKRLAANS